MYLTQGLRRAVQQTPGAIASVFQGRRRTFAELGARVARLGGLLRSLGVAPGDRVGMLSLNSDWYLEYYPGVYWAGGAVNPINTRWSPAEIAFSLEDCQTGILLVDDHHAAMVAELRGRCPGLHTVVHVGDGPAPDGMLGYEALLAQAEPVDDALRGGEDLAGVFYTGGTTGSPKGVMLPHRGLYSNAVGVVAEGAVQHGCIGLHTAPMFHLADGCFMNAMFASGGTHVIVPRFDPVSVLGTIQDEGVTEALLVPTMIQMLVDHPDIGRFDIGSLRNVLYGASPISEGLLDRAMRAIPSAGFTQLYGMTELSPMATVLSQDMHREAGRRKGRHRSAGRAAIGCEVRVVDAMGNEVARGEVGEVAVRGPGVMLGYWNKPAETAAALRDGWMFTGDGGRMDEDGYLFIVDRIKDMIVTGGENVYSVEVESAVAAHPAVASCAVIGVPNDQWGELVHAFIVRKPGASVDEAAIVAHCKERIAGYKCPRQVSFIDAMPLSGAGKILKTQLRAPFWEGRERKVA
ncbi:long-chain-fatty-acid--CoA ligase [Pseudorhodoferax soli]|uniref:Long-chain acyl-CoA synthetase n=1 Tax=Pseudorhodoferax soli TaxID=545864 RepID=A0A368XSA2_9BURK|nr:long-chain-fatty-acid--CoA ligase [Pseudorhodoferax soli]RCW69417.1 long-chain acyl-CoA synthetase [Pseudorhodoferax soli]